MAFAKYIYPDDINMSVHEYDSWVLDVIDKLRTKYKDVSTNYVFDRILYWKLENSHNVVIKRDKEWFAKSLPKFKGVWDQVLYFRENLSEARQLAERINGKKNNFGKKTTLFLDSDSEEDPSNKEPICVDSDSE